MHAHLQVVHTLSQLLIFVCGIHQHGLGQGKLQLTLVTLGQGIRYDVLDALCPLSGIIAFLSQSSSLALQLSCLGNGNVALLKDPCSKCIGHICT